MDEFPSDVRELIGRARAGDAPTVADRERVRNKLALGVAPLVGSAGVSLAGKSAAATLGKSSLGMMVAKVTAGAVLAVGAVGAYRELRPAESAEVAEAAVKSSESLEVPRASGSSASLGLPSPSPVREEQAASPQIVRSKARPTTAPPRAVPPASVAVEATRRSEVDLLAEAQSKLSRGAPRLALDLVEEHRREFPSSVLGAERLAVSVLALCALGQTSEAKTAFQTFERVAPSSPLRPRLLASCVGNASRANDLDTIPPLTGN